MFEFTKDCVLGVEQIDNEHRHLFELINRGIQMLDDGYMYDRYGEIKDLLEELNDYAERHFEDEEIYMEKIRDPELLLQRAAHVTFRDKIREFSFADIDDLEEQQKLLENLMAYLAKWLYHHIISSDILIGKLPPLEEWMLRENPCEYTDEYKLGIPLIDLQHENLFEILSELNAMLRTETSRDDIEQFLKIVGKLKVYTESHFADEEAYMKSIGYEGLPSQKCAHEAFIRKIEEISPEELEENPKEYTLGLVEFLLGWLVNHILNADKKIPVS